MKGKRAMMLDWNDYRRQLKSTMGDLGKLSPGTMEGYRAIATAHKDSGHLDAKTRDLVGVGKGRLDGILDRRASHMQPIEQRDGARRYGPPDLMGLRKGCDQLDVRTILAPQRGREQRGFQLPLAGVADENEGNPPVRSTPKRLPRGRPGKTLRHAASQRYAMDVRADDGSHIQPIRA